MKGLKLRCRLGTADYYLLCSPFPPHVCPEVPSGVPVFDLKKLLIWTGQLETECLFELCSGSGFWMYTVVIRPCGCKVSIP